MSATLDPLIAQKLEAFGRRWRRLVLWRGVCSAVFTLLAAMTLVSLADFLVLMPDWLRLVLSFVSYAGTLAVFWWTCGRTLLHLPGPRELARLLEKAQPELREDLISAVELGAVKDGAQWDSPVFRSLLQENVVGRIKNLRVDSLLPRRLIAFWLRAAVTVAIVCGGLFFIPGFHYDRLIVRAFAPLADVERVSRVTITVLEPKASDRWQPQGDTLFVVAEIAGPETRKVTLETFTKKGERTRLAMSPLGGRRFSVGVPLGADDLQFRVRAGDGLTRKFTVQTRPRPNVAKFDKTYRFPAYSRLAPRHAVDDTGDLTALEGAEVDLVIVANQPLQRAALEVEIKGRTNHLPLTVTTTNSAQGTVPLKAIGTYRVLLTAAETGFENKFSPQYELRPVPDLVPRVVIDHPKQYLIVPPEEVLLLQATAGDDIGLARVQQVILVNEEPFSQITLSEETKTNLVVSRQWDLLQLGTVPGDRVTTKLVAIDLKGNRAESTPLHLLIGSSGLDSKRLRALEAKRALLDSLTTTRNAAQKMRASMQQDMGNRALKGNELQVKQLLQSTLTGLADVEQSLEKNWSQLKETLPLGRPGRESADLSKIGGLLGQARRDYVPGAKAELEAAVKEVDQGGEPAHLRQAAKVTQQVSDFISAMESVLNDLLATDQADVITENLNQLAREQDRMNRQAAAEAAQSPNAWQRLARREGGAAKEVQIVEDLLRDLKIHVPRSQADRAGKPLDNLKLNRADLEKIVSQESSPADLQSVAVRMQKSIELAAADMRPLNRELTQRADKARDTLNKLTSPATAGIERLRRNLEDSASAAKRLAEGARRGQTAKLEAQLKEAQGSATENWKAAVQQLKDRAEVEEVRRDADAPFVVDLTKAAQSLSALRAAAGGETNSANFLEPVREMEKALRTIEAGHGLTELIHGAKHLAQQERWENRSMDALTSQPKDWDWMEARMKAVPGELKKANLPDRAANAVTEVSRSPAALAVDQEMSRRQSTLQAANALPEPTEKIYTDLLMAQREIEAALADARRSLNKSAPKLNDMMAGLARAAQELEKKSTDATKSDKEASAVPEEAKKELAQQQDLNKQIEELQQAIRRDANVQDLGSETGRERARDADDAAAMLREPPTKAEEALREATQTQEYLLQRNALTEAAAQQKKTADTLNQLAKHYAGADATQVAESRQALRKAEEDLGIKGMLDDQYALAEKLNDLAKQSPEEMLRQLEHELGQNPVMRQELQTIAKDTLGQAKDTLQEAAGKEKELSRAVEIQARAQQQLGSAAEQAREIARQARELAEKDAPAAARQAEQAQANAAAEIEKARQALQSAAEKTPVDFQKPAETLARQMAEVVPALQQAARELNAAAQKAAKAKESAPQQSQMQAAEAAKDTASRVAEHANQLAQQAKTVAENLDSLTKPAVTAEAKPAASPPPSSVVPQELAEQAKRLVQQAKDMVAKSIPEISRNASKAKLDVSREMQRATHAIRDTSTKVQNNVKKPAYELSKQLGDLVQPLKDAGQELRQVADKAGRVAQSAAKPDQSAAAKTAQEKSGQAAEQAARMAEQAQQLANALMGIPPAQQQTASTAQPEKKSLTPASQLAQLAQQARQLAAQAAQLASREVPAIGQQAAQAGASAAADLSRAQQSLQTAAAGVPADFSQSPQTLAKQMAGVAQPLQQAGSALKSAGEKAGQAGKSSQSGQGDQAGNSGKPGEQPGQGKGQGKGENQGQSGKGSPGSNNPNSGSGQGDNSGKQQPAGQGQGQSSTAQSAQARANQAAQQASGLAQQAQEIASALAGMAQGGSEASSPSSNQSSPSQAGASGQSAANASPSSGQAGQPGQSAKQSSGSQGAASAKSSGSTSPASLGGSSSKQSADASGQSKGGSKGSLPVPSAAKSQAAQQQAVIGGNVTQAGGDIERAGRHETRLGTPQGDALQNVGRQTQTVGNQTIPETQGALAKAPTVAEAQTALDTARAAVESQVKSLDAALALAAGNRPTPNSPASGDTSPEQSKWMARALDRLDSEMNGQPSNTGQQTGQGENPGKAKSASSTSDGESGVSKSNQPGQPGQSQPSGDGKPSSQADGKSSASNAMKAAADAQNSSMMASRAQGKTPGDKPKSENTGEGNGAAIVGGPEGLGVLPQLRIMRGGEWGKLPPKLAQGLVEAQREGVAGEYRSQVDTYFRVIAEKAKDKKP